MLSSAAAEDAAPAALAGTTVGALASVNVVSSRVAAAGVFVSGVDFELFRCVSR